MTPPASLIQKPILPMLLLVAHLSSCSSDEVTGPNSPGAEPLPATGRIVVSVFSEPAVPNLSFTIDDVGSWALRPNEDVSVGGLPPGAYRVNLTPPTPSFSCSVRDGIQRTAVVRAGGTTSVRYYIDCGPRPDRR